MTRAIGAGPLAVLAAALVWATTGAVAAMAPEVSPIAIAAAAWGVGGLLLALTAAPSLRRERPALRANARLIAWGAAAVAIYPLAFYSSMRMAGVAIGTVVSLGSAPAAAALIERVVDGTPLSRRWVAGSSIGLLGVAALSLGSGHSAAGPARGADTLIGILLGLVAGATYAVYSWGAATLMRRGVGTRAALGSIFGIGAVGLLPVLAATGAPILGAPGHLAVVGYLAAVSVFAGYLLFGAGLARVRASTATSLTLAEPAGAALIAVLVLGERLPALGWLGIAALFVSLMITSVHPRGTSGRAGGRRTERTRHDLRQTV